MRYVLAIILLFSCEMCYSVNMVFDNDNTNKISPVDEWTRSIDFSNSDEVAIYESGRNVVNGTHQLQKCDLVLSRKMDRLEKRIKSMENSIDKMFSMTCDMEEKFMGNDRMELIVMPEHYLAVHIPKELKQLMEEK